MPSELPRLNSGRPLFKRSHVRNLQDETIINISTDKRIFQEDESPINNDEDEEVFLTCALAEYFDNELDEDADNNVEIRRKSIKNNDGFNLSLNTPKRGKLVDFDENVQQFQNLSKTRKSIRKSILCNHEMNRQQTSNILSGITTSLNESSRGSRWKIATGYLHNYLANTGLHEGRQLVLELLVVGASRAYGLWKENIQSQDFDELINLLVPEQWQITTGKGISYDDIRLGPMEKAQNVKNQFKKQKSTKAIDTRYKLVLTSFSVIVGLAYGIRIYYVQLSDTAQRIVGPGIIIARACGFGAIFWTIILFQTMSRHVNTWLFKMTRLRYFLIGHNIHVFAAMLLILNVIVHVFFHLCTTLPTIAGAVSVDELNKIVQCDTHWPRWILWPMCDPFNRNYSAWHMLFASTIGLSGVLSATFLSLMWWTSQPKFKKKHHNIFTRVHLICMSFYVILLMIHGSNNWIGVGWPLAYILLPIFTYYMYTRFLRRTWGSYCSARIIRFEPLSLNLMEIDVKINSSTFFKKVHPGQFILLNVPMISKFEYHPFSVCFINKNRPTIDKDDNNLINNNQVITFIITTAGDWTKKTYSKLCEIDTEILQSAESKIATSGNNLVYSDGSAILDVPCRVDGPFSAPAQGMYKELSGSRSVVICVGAGVGITPFLSVLESMYKENNDMSNSDFHLYWMTRKLSDFITAGELIDTYKLRNEKIQNRIFPHLYITGGDDIVEDDTSAFLFRSAISTLCKENDYIDDHFDLHDPSGHLLSNIRFGRPEFTREFQSILDQYADDYYDYQYVNVSVYVCGGIPVQNTVRAACDAGLAYEKVKSTFTMYVEEF